METFENCNYTVVIPVVPFLNSEEKWGSFLYFVLATDIDKYENIIIAHLKKAQHKEGHSVAK